MKRLNGFAPQIDRVPELLTRAHFLQQLCIRDQKALLAR
jgi:hypothetical protein